MEKEEFESLHNYVRGLRTIIAGSRDITDYDVLLRAIIKCPWDISSVVSGCARGVDKLGEQYAEAEDLPLSKFPADWDKFGRRAGFIRNLKMSKEAQALLAIWNGQSKGTKNMIDIATKKGLRVFVYRTNDL